MTGGDYEVVIEFLPNKVRPIDCEFPMIGSDQNHIKKNVRRQVYETHAIDYRVNTETVFILRLLGPGEVTLKG
jgi:plasmid stabilization system protein ParE